MSVLLGQSRVVYQWLRLEQLNQWWHWLLLAVLVALIVAHAVTWYRRDWSDLARPTGWAMLVLRLAALFGILLYFFELDKRIEQRVVRDSRVAVLIDTSLSMTALGTPSRSGVPSQQSRIEEVVQLVSNATLLQDLTAKHQVTVYRFDQSARPVPVVSLEKHALAAHRIQSGTVAANPSEIPADSNLELEHRESDMPFTQTSARRFLMLACVLAALSLTMIVLANGAQLVGARTWRPGGWLLLVGSTLLLVSLGLGAIGFVPNTRYSLSSLLSVRQAGDLEQRTPSSVNPDDSIEPGKTLTQLPGNWAEALNPTGVESRIGDAVRAILDREIGNPLAGIVLITDGRNNAGLDPRATITAAQNARVPFMVIGVGSDKRPANLQVVEVDAPRRLYPGDRFSVSALIGSDSYQGRTVTVQFLSGRRDEKIDQMLIETESTIEIPADGSLVTTSVELSPKAVGQWSYAARVVPLAGEADESDNAMKADVDVIERQNRVLIVAGGPLREYQFARNLLYRDHDVQSHVYLQSGDAGTSQEAQKLLTEFPASQTELAQYDAVLAFDADWTKIPEKSIQALEKWVAEQAGGLLLMAGSVETPKWLSRSASGPRSQTLRDLSPVILDVRGSALLAAGRIEGEAAWPLTITPDGMQTEFMWLTDQPQGSYELWQSFEGVHTYYAAYELKPGAKALALFSDPTSAAGGQQPIYLASQFYGAGRVVFQGGGEMWRLRSLGDQYFDRYYTKLVRWISQGRLLLDSDRGILLVDREEAVQGEQVSLRAVLKNERYEPLVQNEVVARLIDPKGLNVPLVLRPMTDGSQPGVYTGQFSVLTPGTYRVQLQLGGLASNEFLRAQVQARVPRAEMQNVQRNETLLGQLASETGGHYWKGCEEAAAKNETGQALLAAAITPQDQVVYTPGTPDREFQLRWLGWLMTWIATALSLEWLTRRIHRLA